MYKVLLVFKDENISEKIKRMNIWGENSEFEISAVLKDGAAAYDEVRKQHYDLAVMQTDIDGMDGLQLLRHIRSERLCSCVVLFSSEPNFENARQGIIYGAFDYLTEPLTEKSFCSIFDRIENRTDKKEEVYHSEEILSCIEQHGGNLEKQLADTRTDIYNIATDNVLAENAVISTYDNVVNELFKQNEWLDLYIPHIDVKEYVGIERTEDAERAVIETANEVWELYPKVQNPQMQDVILYILNNPESDLKQKTIASKLYMNSSYLSTVFATQTGMRFVDYITTVRLKRAGWLLKNTEMKITEIALRLDYKDVGYFSQLFKKQYGIVPSQYRLPDNYNYQI